MPLGRLKLFNMSKNCGFELPKDFNSKDYDNINDLVHKIEKPHQPLNEKWRQYSSGWRAISYRFKSTVYHDEMFRKVINDNAFEGKYLQERELFNFFVNGFSTIETFTYTLYYIGSFLKPNIFSNKPRDVTPDVTKNKYVKAYPDCDLTQYLDKLVTSLEFKEWKTIRNSLAHRIVPSRIVHISTRKTLRQPDIWKLKELNINEDLTLGRRKWLAQMLNNGFKETVKFLI